MTGMSAYERDIRDRLTKGLPFEDYHTLPIEAGVLRGLLADIERWRRIASIIDDERRGERP